MKVSPLRQREQSEVTPHGDRVGCCFMKKRIDIDTNEIIRLYETELLSFAEIAEILGVSRSSVYKRYRETGRKPRKQGFQRPGLKRTRKPRKSSFTDVDIARIIKRYEDGNSSVLLSIEFGCSDVHIRSLLHQHGAKVRTRQQAQALRREKQNPTAHTPVEPTHIENLPTVVKNYRADGLLIDEIAHRTGITRLEVFEILNSY